MNFRDQKSNGKVLRRRILHVKIMALKIDLGKRLLQVHIGKHL